MTLALFGMRGQQIGFDSERTHRGPQLDKKWQCVKWRTARFVVSRLHFIVDISVTHQQIYDTDRIIERMNGTLDHLCADTG